MMHDRIREIIESKRDKPMSWDGNDCLLGLAAPLARLVSGNDEMFGSYAGKYTSMEGAIRTFKAAGFDSLANLVASEMREIPMSDCEAGDIIAMPCKGTFKYTLGVFDGEQHLIYAPHGLVAWSSIDGFRAFTARGAE